MSEPITVNASAKPELWGQAARYGLVAASAAVASWTFHDAIVTGAVVTFAGAAAALLPGIGAYLWGRLSVLVSHREKKVMAAQLPDSIATVTTP